MSYPGSSGQISHTCTNKAKHIDHKHVSIHLFIRLGHILLCKYFQNHVYLCAYYRHPLKLTYSLLHCACVFSADYLPLIPTTSQRMVPYSLTRYRSSFALRTHNLIFNMEKVCAEQTKQTADSCFRLVGPHQRRVYLAALRGPRLTYPRQG